MIPLKSLFGIRGSEMPPPEEPSTSSSSLMTAKNEDNPQNQNQAADTSESQRILVASAESGPSQQQPVQKTDTRINIEELDEDDWSKKYWEAIAKVEANSNQKPDLSKFQSPARFWKKPNGVDAEMLRPISTPPTDSPNGNEHVPENPNVQNGEQRVPAGPVNRRRDGQPFRRASRNRERRAIRWERFNAPEQQPASSTQRKLDTESDQGADNTAIFTFTGKAPTSKKTRRARIFDALKGIVSFLLRKREERLAKRRQIMQWKAIDFTKGFQRLRTAILALHVVQILYYMCLSPYNPQPVDPQWPWWKKLPHHIQKVVFGFIAGLATWRTVNNVKYYVLLFLVDKKPVDISEVVFSLSMGFMQLNYTYFVTFQQDKLHQFLKALGCFDATTLEKVEGDEEHTKSFWTFKRVAILYAIGTIPAILRTILYDGFSEWNAKGLLLQQGTDFKYDWNTWTTGNSQNTTEFYIQSENEAAYSTHLCGIIDILMSLSQKMMVDAVRNLIIVVALVNDEIVQRFGKTAETCLLSMLPFMSNIRLDLKCWQRYRDAKAKNSITNDIFEQMLIINHGNNTIILTFILVLCLKKQVNWFQVFFYACQTGKALIAYYIARRTFVQNKTTQKWIKTCHGQEFKVGTVPYSRELMLLELKEEPLGLGNDHFLINDAFLYKLVATAFSILGLLLSSNYLDD